MPAEQSKAVLSRSYVDAANRVVFKYVSICPRAATASSVLCTSAGSYAQPLQPWTVRFSQLLCILLWPPAALEPLSRGHALIRAPQEDQRVAVVAANHACPGIGDLCIPGHGSLTM
jgi:hypothetical protein